jgi:hypothetical protein
MIDESSLQIDAGKAVESTKTGHNLRPPVLPLRQTRICFPSDLRKYGGCLKKFSQISLPLVESYNAKICRGSLDEFQGRLQGLVIHFRARDSSSKCSY